MDFENSYLPLHRIAAPNCLALLGACAAVAYSDAAAGIEISKPLSGSFTYLKYGSSPYEDMDDY